MEYDAKACAAGVSSVCVCGKKSSGKRANCIKKSQGALVLSEGHHVHGNADAERAKTRRRAKRIKKNKGQQGAHAG